MPRKYFKVNVICKGMNANASSNPLNTLIGEVCKFVYNDPDVRGQHKVKIGRLISIDENLLSLKLFDQTIFVLSTSFIISFEKFKGVWSR